MVRNYKTLIEPTSSVRELEEESYYRRWHTQRNIWLKTTHRDRPLLADSVEKVGHPKLTAHWMAKMPSLRAAT